jgi:hypothetical protein
MSIFSEYSNDLREPSHSKLSRNATKTCRESSIWHSMHDQVVLVISVALAAAIE